MINNKIKPILILRKVNDIKSIIYTIIMIGFIGFLIFLGIGGILSDEIKFKIIGIICLIFAPYFYFHILRIEAIICYDDYLVAKYPLWETTLYYSDIRYYWYNRARLLINSLQIYAKKRKFFLFMRIIDVSFYLFDEHEIFELEKLLESKNVRYFSLFGSKF